MGEFSIENGVKIDGFKGARYVIYRIILEESRRKGKLRAGLGAETEWSDRGPVNGRSLAGKVFASRGEPIKGGVDKERASLCRWKGGEAERRGLCELGLQTLAGRFAGCQWKERRGFVGYHGGVCVEGFPQTP